MEHRRISHTQLMALLWGGVLAPTAELLPGLLLPGVGRGVWLSVLAAVPGVLLWGWLLEWLSGGNGLARGLYHRVGPILGRLILIIYMVWGELLLALRLRVCAQRLMGSGERDGALWFFLLGLTALALWIGTGRLDAFARAGQLYFGALLVMGGAVLFLAAPRVELVRLLPVWVEDAAPVLMGSVGVWGVWGWGFPAAFLIGEVAFTGENGGRHWLFWVLGGCLVLAAAQLIILGSFGAELAMKLQSPFFALAGSVGVQGAFQRIGGLIAAVWLLSDLLLVGVLVFAQRTIIKVVWKRASEEKVGGVAVLAAGVLAAGVFPNRGSAVFWNGTVLPAGNLILGFGLPLFIGIIDWIRRKLRGKSISCGEKTR